MLSVMRMKTKILSTEIKSDAKFASEAKIAARIV